MSVSSDRTGDVLLKQGRVARGLWLGVGVVLVGVGFVGLFLPLLPTTDFMLLALPCFARSSPQLESWLLNHPRFGGSLRAWRDERAVGRYGKIAACAGMAGGYALFCMSAHPNWFLALAVAALMIGAAAWVVSRPRPEKQ